MEDDRNAGVTLQHSYILLICTLTFFIILGYNFVVLLSK